MQTSDTAWETGTSHRNSYYEFTTREFFFQNQPNQPNNQDTRKIKFQVKTCQFRFFLFSSIFRYHLTNPSRNRSFLQPLSVRYTVINIYKMLVQHWFCPNGPGVHARTPACSADDYALRFEDGGVLEFWSVKFGSFVFLLACKIGLNVKYS